MRRVANRLKCTEGQLYTVFVGALVAVALFAVGVPPVLRHEDVTPAAFRPQEGSTDLPEASGGPPLTTPPVSSPVVGEDDADESVESEASSLPSSTTTSAVTTTTTTPVEVSAPPDQPLGPASPRRVTDHGFTSSTAGAPADGAEIPEHGMPVGARAGTIDRQSFARLSGQGPLLELRLVEDPSAHRLVALAAVEACAVTELDWDLGAGEPQENAPEYDPRRCVSGVQAADGTWQFDLSAIEPVPGRAGIALVPVMEGSATFQITFSATRVD